VPASIRIGCSGWQYRDWRGRFYPTGLPAGRWLEYYAEHFDTVELNASFYRLQAATTFRSWSRRLPAGFVMAVKASRYLTHTKRLREPAEPLARLWSRAEALGSHLGPVLYQLPPRWKFDGDRLRGFLEALPDGRPQAIEFRDRAWNTPEAYELLVQAGVALCLHDMPGSNPDPRPVGPFVYVRFHGAGQRYGGRYDDDTLRAWADRLAAWREAGLTSWVYFNNDIGGEAPRDATRLRELLPRYA
jgi:uncharacterized protein YecE (DUF72 family)